MAYYEEDGLKLWKIGELRYRLETDTNGFCDDGVGGFLPDIVEKQFHGQSWEINKEIQYLEESCMWEEAPVKTVAEILGGRLSLINMSESSDAEVESSLLKILILLKEHGVEIECVNKSLFGELSGAPVLLLHARKISNCAFEETATPQKRLAVKLNSTTFKILSPEEIRNMYSQIIDKILPERVKDLSELRNPVQTWLVDLGL